MPEGNGSPEIKPVTPQEIAGKKLKEFPPAVIESFNTLIARNFSEGEAVVLQKDVVKLMQEKGLSREDIVDKGWLDAEDVYREAGWKVTYDKPAYNETYEPSFIFKPKASRKK